MSNLIINPYTPFPAAAGTSFYVGHSRTAAITGSGPTQELSITWSDGGTGRTPTAALFYVTQATTDATDTTGACYSYGAADGTNNVSCGAADEDAQGSSDSDKISSQTYCIQLLNNDTTLDAQASLSSFGSDKVTISWNDYPTNAVFIHCIAFTGTDAVECGVAAPATTDAGTVNKTGLGESADVVIVGAASATGGNFSDARQAHWAADIGFYTYDGTARNHNILISRRSGRPTMDGGWKWSETYIAHGLSHNVGSEDQAWALSNHASGFTITTHETSTIDVDHDFWYLAISLPTGVSARAGTFTSANSGTYPEDKAITDPAFTPQAVLLAHGRGTNTADVGTNTDIQTSGHSLGCAISASSEFCSSNTSEDGSADSNTQCRSDTKLIHMPTGDGTTSIQGNLKSLDASTGFTVEYTVNSDDAAARAIYLAFEEN